MSPIPTTSPSGGRGPLAATASRLARRYRAALFIVAFCGWALLIREVHLRAEGARSTKGAAELLDIAALPVT
jgi:hypothetical protein